MGGHEAQPRDRGHAVGGPEAVDRPDELGEVRPAGQVQLATGPALCVDVAEARLGRQVVAIRVDVLAEQRDLAIAPGRQRPGLGHDLVERTAPLGPAAERDDAVGARLVAAVHDRQPGGDRRLPGDAVTGDRGRPGGRQVVGRTDERPTHDRRRPDRPDRRLRRGQAQSVDQLNLLVGPQEEVDRGIAPAQPGPVRLAHRAAGQHHAQAGVGRLEPGEMTLPPDDLLLGAFADGAGVDHDEVGRFEAGRLGASGGEQAPGHLLGVAPVHLAAEGPDVERRQRSRIGPVFGQALVGGSVGAPSVATRRWGWHELEDRELAVHLRVGDPVWEVAGPSPSTAMIRSPTSGGTHSSAWASAYVPVSPW